jgi:hypothetical protein
MEASHNDTRPTDRPLYDVSSLSTPSTYGPSTSTVQQLRTTTASKLSFNSGPRDAGCSARTTTAGKLSSNTGQATHGAENNNLGMLQYSSPQGMGNFVNSFEFHLQVSQSPSVISSVFLPHFISHSGHYKRNIWKGEFIDLNLLLKSAKDLVNEPSLEGELAIKGGDFYCC